MWETETLHTESDVEQKLIYPLLVEGKPQGLGFPSEVILTKQNIRRLQVGKGKSKKMYFPDYIIANLGFPLVVIETKSPEELIAEGYREARLYASELNALFDHSVQPAKYVVACNGVEIWYGYHDEENPLNKIDVANLGVYSPGLADLIERMNWDVLAEKSKDLASQQRPEGLFKPRRLLGGSSVQNEEVSINSFGANVTASISHIFNPESVEDRVNIVKNAYVSSSRRERYIDPIDKIIRAAKPPSESKAQTMNDTSDPKEVIGLLQEKRSLEHKVLLLVGGVGAGKSTFVDYLQEVALPAEISSNVMWARMNMNYAPGSYEEIFPWLREELIRSCRESLPELDFDDLEVIKKVLRVEINKFKKGVGRLYKDQGTYDDKLGDQIQSFMDDRGLFADAHMRFCCGERDKLAIVVLDNCDKKGRDEQLLMFEAAQWLQNQFRCLVILPLRDETFDNYRAKPPLDTALKDMVFRIEPPLFQHVLIKRVQLALKEMETKGGNKLAFSLPNGFKVEYPKSEQAFYLTSIIKSLFEHDRFARRMIVGLAGRNMRDALEIFLEFCSSGYIGDDEIFKIRQSEGNYALPFHKVATVILRMNRRFYESDSSYIKNIFSTSRDDKVATYFCRYMILRWLRQNFKEVGASGLPGYFRKREVKHAIVPYGLSPEVVDREVNSLLASKCIVAEHLRDDFVVDEDLVKIGPTGFVHLNLVSNINYLAAIAEDTFFEDRSQAERIAGRIKEFDKHFHLMTALRNAEEVVAFLEDVKERMCPPNGSFVETDVPKELVDLSEARDALFRVERSQSQDPWFDADKRLRRGSIHEAVISNSVHFGFFVEFSDGICGLVHNSKVNGMSPAIGDKVAVKINWVDVIQRKMDLTLESIVEEDAGDQVGQG